MTDPSVGALLLQVTLSQATTLARAGRYQDAEGLLSELPRDEAATPRGLDLLARIRAQQGRLLEAEALWSQASAIDTTNEAYRAALRRIAKMQRRPVWLASLSPLIVGLAIILATVFASFAVRQTLIDLRRSMPESPAVSSTLKSPPDLKLNVPGTLVQADAGEIVVTFAEGLFARGTGLKAEAQKKLTMLGRQLEPFVGSLSVAVMGHTDDLPVPPGGEFPDNAVLGMRRAVAVFQYLQAATRLPSSIFSLKSLGESQSPFPNDTVENRSRNRTVVIRISSKSSP